MGNFAHKGICSERYDLCDAILPLPHLWANSATKAYAVSVMPRVMRYYPFPHLWANSPTKAYAVRVMPRVMRYYPTPICGRFRPQRHVQ